MLTANRACAKCGAEFYADAPEEFCSACLLETGLFTHEPVAAGDVSAVASARADDSGSVEDVNGSSSRATDPAHNVTDFGGYELLEKIGRGGQGLVYRARQKSLNRTVALKVIGLGQLATTEHLKRFRLEAEAAAKLDHPCIVPIYEVGEREGSCYFSMKFIDGGQLDEVARRKPMPPRRAAELIAKVARTVHYAHEHGILHRDIKPGNILLDANGEPHLTDFGLARLLESESTVTRTMEVMGTPSYMAPEQAVGNNAAASKATDVYGLGAVLYQLLTGQPPFAGGTTYETIKLLLDTEPRQPRVLNRKIDRDLSTICLKCLEKDPRRRYSSALALAEDLEHWLKHEPIQAHRTGIFTSGKKWLRRNPTTALLFASSLAFATTLGVIIWKSESERPPPSGIAVLPFENLSQDKENAYFADGVQEDILTKLAKIADLKVISRTSVMPYRGARNTRQIGNALRVSHVLEGSVQRAGSRVRVNAQLIDTRTDTHVWAEEYDRDLSDIFAIQSEIAQRIADQLRAKISAGEKGAIEERPTKDLAAYDLYVHAASLIDSWPYGAGGKEPPISQAVELLNQAIARDPVFLLAYCRLAEAHDTLYFWRFDHTPARLALAEAAIDSAVRLKSDSADAHLALARHLYWGYLDYDQARDELAIAARTLPNDARVFQLAGLIDRRQGRWRDAVRNFERASELDPQNADHLAALRDTYRMMRAYKQARETADRRLALKPNAILPTLSRFHIDLEERADTRPLHAVVDKILRDDPGAAQRMVGDLFILALYERDFAAADRALAALTETDSRFAIRYLGWVWINRACAEGLIARAKGDAAAAQAAFIAARVQQEETLGMQPEDTGAICALGLIDAALGRKEQALREGRRAVELLPIAKAATDGADILYFYAVICAWTGERDLAIEQLETLAKIPAGVSYGELRLDPSWDSLRGDPRFEKIVASLAAK
jgi:serine/threonine protein kinase/tetratricopeptide (TPR) repeat protein